MYPQLISTYDNHVICNMKCGYCFGRFVDVGTQLSEAHLTKNKTFEIVKGLADAYGS